MVTFNNKKKITGIYKITSPSNRMYIGQSWDVHTRWRTHKKTFLNQGRGNSILMASFEKYGVDAHSFEVINILPLDVSQDDLDNMEQFYILQYKAGGCELMNLTTGGSRGKQSEISKKKLSDRRRENDWCKGRKLSEGHKRKISEGNKGKKMGEKLDIIFSKYRTKEQAQWMGALNKGKVRTEENRRKISETLKMREDNKGVSHHMAKLTVANVLEIREKYATGGHTSRSLAKEYLISKTNILDIVHKRIWRHI